MEMASLLEGRYVSPSQICCVLSLDTINYKHYINKWKEQGMVVNVCKGQKARSAVFFQNGLILISSVTAETIRDRLSVTGEY